MGMFDIIENVPLTYDSQVKLWGCQMDTFQVGSRVPAVGTAQTYSVQLKATEPDLSPLYVYVQDCVLTNIRPVPLDGCVVFDKWGGFVAHMSPPTVQPVVDVMRVKFCPTSQEFTLSIEDGMLTIAVRNKP